MMNNSFHLIILLQQILSVQNYDIANLLLSNSYGGEVTTSGEWCQSWKNLVCGSDGITYWNECLFQKSQDKTPDLSLISSGACNPVECEGCQKKFTLLQYCTSNNRLVPDQCTVDCLVDEYPLIIEDFNGCKSNYPTSREMEVATAAIFNKIVEELLSRTLAQPQTKNETMLDRKELEPGAVVLPGFKGQISSNGTIYKVGTKRGWMKEITWVRMPETFSISSVKLNRLMFRLKTGSLQLGYNQFSVSEASGKRERNTKIAVTVDNATLALIIDIDSDKYDCTRISPVEVRLIDVPTVELAWTLPGDSTNHFPRNELDGFMKENTLRKINQAIESTLYKRMQRVGCLSWSDKTGKAKCFGAFQRRFCSK